jgi:hypothetical protein
MIDRIILRRRARRARRVPSHRIGASARSAFVPAPVMPESRSSDAILETPPELQASQEGQFTDWRGGPA